MCYQARYTTFAGVLLIFIMLYIFINPPYKSCEVDETSYLDTSHKETEAEKLTVTWGLSVITRIRTRKFLDAVLGQATTPGLSP